MESRRPDLRGLRALLRAPELGSYNLAAYVAAHEAELGLDLSAMAGPDEVVAPRLLALLERRRAEARRAAEGGILATLRQLQAGARWRDEQVVLPPGLFFRLASPATGKKYIQLLGDGLDVTVSRQLLRRAGVALRAFRDVSVSVDADGVHLCWGGRGRLNFYPQQVKGSLDALVVTLPPRSVSRRMPLLVGEVLADMGFGI
jgi:hypothetical protein